MPEPARPQLPALEHSPGPPLATAVLVRIAARAAAEHHVACGLVFSFADYRLLVGTDPSTLAIVLSQDPELIDRYSAGCEVLPAEEYLGRYGGC